MNWRQKILSNMFLRNMLADLFGRSAYSKTPGTFTPFFQYKIGDYQPDHYLYFPTVPYTLRYKNEIFNKLYEYSGHDIITFLEFHYSAFQDKDAYLQFVKFEISDRLRRNPKEKHRQKLQSAQEWVLEKQRELKTQQQVTLQQAIENEVKEVLPGEGSFNQASIENIAKTLSEKLTERLDQMMTSTEEKMQTLTDSYIIGKIELNNQNHEDKLMKLFKLLQAVQAPPQVARAEQLFKRFSDTDVAAILWLHFLAFNDKKIETIPRNIRKADELIPDKNPKVKQLADALRDFFYS